ncbi:hypothetical protein BDN71DRAFT_1480493 [Pleurotus eryngii]|uniref:Uncharacterized protein n=1 Tax=Pleurotus eryngii TaxID=5323 RepID=A0A9P6DCM0_PLEER|nr:hypothetical protein BDN71DRAFT_1480493 [Pleurotus eryngii]
MTTPAERRAMLLKALDYAHEAVNLDTTKDGRGAVVAYRKCTALLDEVIIAAALLDEKSTTKQSLSDVRHWVGVATVPDSRNDLFNYSSGRRLVNNDLRLAERRRKFDVDELCRLAAQLAEGGFNRTFLITMHGGFEMVARIPYAVTVPKFYAIASEVATMHFLRSSGLPISEVYDHSPSSDDAAKTEYIFMEFIRGTKLSDILYYSDDLDGVTGTTDIPLNEEDFCVGTDVSLHMWYGRRSQLDIDRGPYEKAEAALIAAACKELAYLHRRSSPISRTQPSAIPASGIPTSSRMKIVGLLDWQHASILPVFLLAGMLGRLQNYDDPVSQALIPPSPPANIDEQDQSEQGHAMGLYHGRLYNKLHHQALSDPVSMLIYRLFDQAGAPWEGETHALKTTLIEGTETLGRLAVSNENYEMAMALAELLKLRVLTEIPEEEVRAKTEANWFLNDMDEEDYTR